MHFSISYAKNMKKLMWLGIFPIITEYYHHKTLTNEKNKFIKLNQKNDSLEFKFIILGYYNC